MDEDTRARFEQAVERKKEEARERAAQARTGTPPPGDEEGGSQDIVRDKGKMTADKWNQ